MCIKIMLRVLLLLLLSNPKAYTQNLPDSILTLKQCVNIAFSNNLEIRQSELQAETDHINLKQAKANLLPDLTGALDHGINQGRSIDPFTNSYINQNVAFGNYNLTTDIPLSYGGQLKNLVKQNRYSYQASQMDLEQLKENITLNIILAYLQILNNEDQLNQSTIQAATTQKQISQLEILNKEGTIIPSELYQLKGQLGADQLQVINSSNALDAARLALCQLLNIPYKKIKVERITADQLLADYTDNPEAIYQAAVTRFPSVAAAVLRRKSDEAAVKVARGQFYPVIGFNGNLNTNFSSVATRDIFLNSSQVPSGDFIDVGGSQVPVITNKSNFNTEKINYFDQFNNNYSTSIGLNIRIPILNAFRARNNLALARIQLKTSGYVEQTAKTQLNQAIEQASFNISAAYSRYKTLLQEVEDFSEAFRVSEVRFNAGVSNQVDYLIAKNNVDQAKIKLIIAQYDYIFRIKILDYYQGKLLL